MDRLQKRCAKNGIFGEIAVLHTNLLNEYMPLAADTARSPP